MSNTVHSISWEMAGRIAGIADALGDLTNNVVFIGGAIAPLLQTHPPFSIARPTKDVDAVIATANYGGIERLHAALHAQGFRLDISGTIHAHRWIAPNGTPFDLVPVGHHVGASGNRWDLVIIDTADIGHLPSGQIIRYASAPGFLGLKWKAFQDRGAEDPYGSHDLEDIIALVASRPKIIAETTSSVPELARYVRDSTAQFLTMEMADDIVSGALANVSDANIVAAVRARLKGIASIIVKS
jgi:hypothetical protein